MISFGNTLLYNRFQQILWKTSLDSRIGIVHSSNKRQYSLNLDFADIFKPIIVDRVIFTLINRKQMDAVRDFVVNENGSVYMNEMGKRVEGTITEAKLKSLKNDLRNVIDCGNDGVFIYEMASVFSTTNIK